MARLFLAVVALAITAIFFAAPVRADEEEHEPDVIIIQLPGTEPAAPYAPAPYTPAPPVAPYPEPSDDYEDYTHPPLPAEPSEPDEPYEDYTDPPPEATEYGPINPLLPPAGAFAGVLALWAVVRYIRTVL
jgi:hypothetical protein